MRTVMITIQRERSCPYCREELEENVISDTKESTFRCEDGCLDFWEDDNGRYPYAEEIDEIGDDMFAEMEI